MSDFRFRDLEESNSTESKKSFKSANIDVSKMQGDVERIESVDNSTPQRFDASPLWIFREKEREKEKEKENDFNKMKDSLEIITDIINDISSAVDTIKTNTEKYERVESSYEDIEYYYVDGKIIIHEISTNIFMIRDRMYYRCTIDDVVRHIRFGSKDVESHITECDEDMDYVRDFISSYTRFIDTIRTNLQATIFDYGIDDDPFDEEEDDEEDDEIDDSTSWVLHIDKNGSITPHIIKDIEDESDDKDEDDETPEYIEPKPDDEDDDAREELKNVLNNIENEPSERRLEPAIDINSLPTMDEVENTTEISSLSDYVRSVESRIDDDAVSEILKNARNARRNRSVQLEYVSGKSEM